MGQRWAVEFVAERRGEFIRLALRPVGWRDWARCAGHWARWLWRDYGDGVGRLDSATAREMGKLFAGIVDRCQWQTDRDALRDYHNACARAAHAEDN